jgi:hypothetical protein
MLSTFNLIMTAWGSAAGESLTAQTVVLNRAIAFTAPNGTPVVAAPGPYRLDPAGVNELRLTSARGPEPLIVRATAIGHPMKLAEPIAVAIPDSGTAFRVTLLFPDGRGLEAIGTTEVVRGRGETGVEPPTGPGAP